jgi:hypothetical protein
MLRRLRTLFADDKGFSLIEVVFAVGGLGALTAVGVLIAHAL